MTTLTITAKGQVTLKKEVLTHLGVQPGDKVDVDLMPGGKLEIAAAAKPKGDNTLEAFFGCLGNPHGIHATIEEINEAIEAGWAGEVDLEE